MKIIHFLKYKQETDWLFVDIQVDMPRYLCICLVKLLSQNRSLQTLINTSDTQTKQITTWPMSQTDARGTDKARSTKQQLQTWRTATANGHRYFTFAGWFSRYAINSVPVTWHLIDARRHGDITNVTKTTVLHNSCLCQLLPTEAHASLKGILKNSENGPSALSALTPSKWKISLTRTHSSWTTCTA